MNFKTIRVTVLLFILAYIAFDAFLTDINTSNWKRSLRIVVYPINADGSVETARYIAKLNRAHFDDINPLLESQGAIYKKQLSEPIRFNLAPELKSLPPTLPTSRSGLQALMWSIKLRFWAWKQDNYTGPKPQIKAYALYFNPNTKPTLQHSTGLKKSKISINYLYADKRYTKQNNVILLHEILHTLGATDKYNLATGLPIYPEGYGNSQQRPLYPQKLAEIMGGRIAISADEASIPSSLKNTVIGRKTAQEIGWLD